MPLASIAWVPMTMSMRAVGQALAWSPSPRRRGDEAGEPADADREALETLDEVVVMLAGEQGGRADHRDLHAGHRRDEGGAQRDLGLAEADIADDQPVHRLAGGEIGEHVVDRAVLIVGFLIGEAIDEGGVAAAVGLGDLGRAQRAVGGGGDQLAGDLADALLHPRLAALPRLAAELVERDALALRAVAGEHVEILDRDVELVAAGIGRARRNRAALWPTGIEVSPS